MSSNLEDGEIASEEQIEILLVNDRPRQNTENYRLNEMNCNGVDGVLMTTVSMSMEQRDELRYVSAVAKSDTLTVADGDVASAASMFAMSRTQTRKLTTKSAYLSSDCPLNIGIEVVFGDKPIARVADETPANCGVGKMRRNKRKVSGKKINTDVRPAKKPSPNKSISSAIKGNRFAALASDRQNDVIDVDDDEMLCVRGASPQPLHSELVAYSCSTDNKTHLQPIKKPKARKCSNKRAAAYSSRSKKAKIKLRGQKVYKVAAISSPGIDDVDLKIASTEVHSIESSDAFATQKQELCKFYMQDQCLKGQSCDYMHEEFPCKYYYLGLECRDDENGSKISNSKSSCKLSHGGALPADVLDALRCHITSAPVEVLGKEFVDNVRSYKTNEELVMMIDNFQAQLKLRLINVNSAVNTTKNRESLHILRQKFCFLNEQQIENLLTLRVHRPEQALHLTLLQLNSIGINKATQLEAILNTLLNAQDVDMRRLMPQSFGSPNENQDLNSHKVDENVQMLEDEIEDEDQPLIIDETSCQSAVSEEAEEIIFHHVTADDLEDSLQVAENIDENEIRDATKKIAQHLQLIKSSKAKCAVKKQELLLVLKKLNELENRDKILKTKKAKDQEEEVQVQALPILKAVEKTNAVPVEDNSTTINEIEDQSKNVQEKNDAVEQTMLVLNPFSNFAQNLKENETEDLMLDSISKVQKNISSETISPEKSSSPTPDNHKLLTPKQALSILSDDGAKMTLRSKRRIISTPIPPPSDSQTSFEFMDSKISPSEPKSNVLSKNVISNIKPRRLKIPKRLLAPANIEKTSPEKIQKMTTDTKTLDPNPSELEVPEKNRALMVYSKPNLPKTDISSPIQCSTPETDVVMPTVCSTPKTKISAPETEKSDSMQCSAQNADGFAFKRCVTSYTDDWEDCIRETKIILKPPLSPVKLQSQLEIWKAPKRFDDLRLKIEEKKKLAEKVKLSRLISPRRVTFKSPIKTSTADKKTMEKKDKVVKQCIVQRSVKTSNDVEEKSSKDMELNVDLLSNTKEKQIENELATNETKVVLQNFNDANQKADKKSNSNKKILESKISTKNFTIELLNIDEKIDMEIKQNAEKYKFKQRRISDNCTLKLIDNDNERKMEFKSNKNPNEVEHKNDAENDNKLQDSTEKEVNVEQKIDMNKLKSEPKSCYENNVKSEQKFKSDQSNLESKCTDEKSFVETIINNEKLPIERINNEEENKTGYDTDDWDEEPTSTSDKYNKGNKFNDERKFNSKENNFDQKLKDEHFYEGKSVNDNRSNFNGQRSNFNDSYVGQRGNSADKYAADQKSNNGNKFSLDPRCNKSKYSVNRNNADEYNTRPKTNPFDHKIPKNQNSINQYDEGQSFNSKRNSMAVRVNDSDFYGGQKTKNKNFNAGQRNRNDNYVAAGPKNNYGKYNSQQNGNKGPSAAQSDSEEDWDKEEESNKSVTQQNTTNNSSSSNYNNSSNYSDNQESVLESGIDENSVELKPQINLDKDRKWKNKIESNDSYNCDDTSATVASPTLSPVTNEIASPTYPNVGNLSDYTPAMEIDGHMSFPAMTYSLHEIKLPNLEVNKPESLDKLLRSNTVDPRLLKFKDKGYMGISSAPPVLSYFASQQISQYDPRRRTGILHTSTAQAYQMDCCQQVQPQNPNIVLYRYMQRSSWYQGLMSTMKMQINHSIAELVRALNNFYKERLIDGSIVFDVFKIDCAGELLEIMRNIGVFIDANGSILEDRGMGQYTGPHAVINSPAPVNATYSFMPQLLPATTPTHSHTKQPHLLSYAPSQHSACPVVLPPQLHAASFVSCYVDAPTLTPMTPRHSCGFNGTTIMAPITPPLTGEDENELVADNDNGYFNYSNNRSLELEGPPRRNDRARGGGCGGGGGNRRRGGGGGGNFNYRQRY